MIAITGATGHLGQALLRQMKSADIPVRAIVRAASDTRLLDGYCTDIVSAELSDSDALARAFAGVDAVIHSAAMVDVRRGRIEALRNVNVKGTRNVIEACRTAGVRRLVFLSSIEALNLKNPERPIRETHGFSETSAIMEYGRTKAEASLLVAEAGKAAGSELETVLICPTGITGPWDYRDSLMTTMVKKVMNGGIPATIPGGFDYVDVRDVAGAVLSAVHAGKSGEAYIVSGEYMDIHRMFDAVEDAAGRHKRRLPLPRWLAAAAGEVSETFSRLTGIPVLFTRSSIAILQTDGRMDCSKAKEDLAYEARPMAESYRDAVAWLSGDENIESAAWKDRLR